MTAPWNRPARLPEASAAGSACRSITVQPMPCRARARRGGGAGQPGADHQGMARCLRRQAPAWRRGRRETRRVAGQRDVALAAAARCRLDHEAHALQSVADDARGTPGRGRGVGRGQAREHAEHAVIPHRRATRRREAIEVERVDTGHDFARPGLHVAERQQQPYVPGFEFEQMQVAGGRRPGVDQLTRECGRRRGRMGTREVGHGQWVLFDRDEEQALAVRWVVAPGGPGGEEVVAEAETGLEDREALAAAPARGQSVARQEHLLRLCEGAAPRVVEVVEDGGAGGGRVAEVDRCGDDGCGLHFGAGLALKPGIGARCPAC